MSHRLSTIRHGQNRCTSKIVQRLIYHRNPQNTKSIRCVWDEGYRQLRKTWAPAPYQFLNKWHATSRRNLVQIMKVLPTSPQYCWCTTFNISQVSVATVWRWEEYNYTTVNHVKFVREVASQKRLKSTNVSQSYWKDKNGHVFFWNTVHIHASSWQPHLCNVTKQNVGQMSVEVTAVSRVDKVTEKLLDAWKWWSRTHSRHSARWRRCQTLL